MTNSLQESTHQAPNLLKNKISSQIEMQIKNQLPTVKIHLQRGYEFQEQKLYDEAAGEFNQVIELDSENFEKEFDQYTNFIN